MKKLFVLSTALLLSACSAGLPLQESPQDAAHRNAAEQSYLACLTREAGLLQATPAGADDIASAAHSRCWDSWSAYRQVTHGTYTRIARSDEERQLAHDKAEAELREFERSARRSVAQGVIENSRKRAP